MLYAVSGHRLHVSENELTGAKEGGKSQVVGENYIMKSIII